MEPKFAAKAAPRRKRKVEARPEAGQGAAILLAREATQVPPTAPRAKETKRAEAQGRTLAPARGTSLVSAVALMQARTEKTKGTEASVCLRREEEIPD